MVVAAVVCGVSHPTDDVEKRSKVPPSVTRDLKPKLQTGKLKSWVPDPLARKAARLDKEKLEAMRVKAKGVGRVDKEKEEIEANRLKEERFAEKMAMKERFAEKRAEAKANSAKTNSIKEKRVGKEKGLQDAPKATANSIEAMRVKKAKGPKKHNVARKATALYDRAKLAREREKTKDPMELSNKDNKKEIQQKTADLWKREKHAEFDPEQLTKSKAKLEGLTKEEMKLARLKPKHRKKLMHHIALKKMSKKSI